MKKNIFLLICIAMASSLAFLGYRDYLYYHNFQNIYNSGSLSELINSNTLEKKSAENYHNLANTWFRTFEETSEIEDLKRAVLYYSGSLHIGEHPDTRYNYEISKKLLEVLESLEQENIEQEEQQQESGNNENEGQESEGEVSRGDEGVGEPQEGNTSEQSTIKDNRGEGYQMGSEDEVSEITPEEKEILKKELENIKNGQLYNQQFFDKKQQEGEFGNIFESFFGRVDRGGDKDW